MPLRRVSSLQQQEPKGGGGRGWTRQGNEARDLRVKLSGSGGVDQSKSRVPYFEGNEIAIKTTLDTFQGSDEEFMRAGTPNVQEGYFRDSRDLDQQVPILTTSSMEHPSKAKSPR